jgi:flagellar motor switch protein FliN
MAASSAPGIPEPSAVVQRAGPEGASAETANVDRPDVVAKVAEFAELTSRGPGTDPAPLDRLLDVAVTVTAELGRVTLSIGGVLKLGIGSVLELDRSVTEPVDLMVQGVRLARGEVVVVDDRFAIRIKENRRPQETSVMDRLPHPPPQRSPTRGEGERKRTSPLSRGREKERGPPLSPVGERGVVFLPPPLWGRVGVGGDRGVVFLPPPLMGEGWGGG